MEIEIHGRDPAQFIDKFGIKFNDEEVQYDIEIRGLNHGNKFHMSRSNQGVLEEPLERMITFASTSTGKFIAKCFTFYSFLQKKWRNMKIKLDQVILNFNFGLKNLTSLCTKIFGF